MTDVQQIAPAKPSAKASPSNEKVVSRNEPAPGGTVSPVQKDRERCQAQLDTVHHQQATTTEGLQKIQEAIEKALLARDATDPAKLAALYRKRRSFEDRLNELAGEEEVHTRHLEQLTGQEQQARAEETAERRKHLQVEGLGIADVIRHTLGLLGSQFSQWKELKDRERITQDILRSLAPQRLTELADFSFATGIDSNFQIVLGQVITEYRRSVAELQSRGNPLPAEMQERIARQQGR